MPRSAASVAPEEIAQFSRHAGDWWNPAGVFKPLHRLNPVRLEYVRDRACEHFGRTAGARDALQGLSVLDIGCGGGLLTEPLVRLGAWVTGLDASEDAIKTARQHARTMGLDIKYVAGAVEDLEAGGQRPEAKKKKPLASNLQPLASFDLITALEIAEHVADLDSFFGAAARLLKPGGLLIVSTLNRTPQSFLLGIVAAEYILRWVPRGTHQWRKFIRPSELARHLAAHGLRAQDITGMVFNPLTGAFELRKGKVGVNYLMTAIKCD